MANKHIQPERPQNVQEYIIPVILISIPAGWKATLVHLTFIEMPARTTNGECKLFYSFFSKRTKMLATSNKKPQGPAFDSPLGHSENAMSAATKICFELAQAF